MADKLYGQQGIDTSYEREQFEYSPDLKYPEKVSTYKVPISTLIQIERSREFKISSAIQDYQALIDRISGLLTTLEGRNKTQAFSDLMSQLQLRNRKEVTKIEDDNSSISQTGDFELYSMLYRMKDSLSKRVDFLLDKFTTQLTDEKDVDKIQEVEDQSITEWLKKEEAYNTFYDGVDHDDVETMDQMEQEASDLEKDKRSMELLHTTLADTSYIHKNRNEYFKGVVDTADMLINQANTLIGDDLEVMMYSVSQMPDLSAAKTQLLLRFKETRNQLDALKGQYMMVDDGKESFANEKNYLFQQMKIKSEEPVRQWLYDVEDNMSNSLDSFSQLMVEGIQSTKNQYDSSVGGVLQFYKNEAYFYNQQITLLQKKEEIRRFFSILEDLGDAGELTDDWIAEYLQVNGYQTSGDV